MKRKNTVSYLGLTLVYLLFFVFSMLTALGQEKSSDAFNKYIKSSGSSAVTFNSRIEKTDKKYLKKYFRQENKLHRKLCKKDPTLADHLFSSSSDPLFYHQKDPNVAKLLKNKTAPKEYFPHNDSLQASLKFLEKEKPQGVDEKSLSNASSDAKKLDENLTHSDKLQQYFRKRKVALKESLSKYPGLKSSVKGYDKVNYYYHEQIAQCKKLFSDPSKAEDAGVKLLQNNSAFKEFIQKNGALSKFGSIPSSWGKNISGLQSILQTKTLMQKDVHTLGSNPQEIVAGKMQPMQQTMGKLKSGPFGKVTNAADIPDFKPNPLKTKPLIDRLEFGTNLQVNQTNTFYPATVNIGLQVAYKLSQKLSPGIGASYLLGLGENWNNISLTHQGIGLRSFIDYQIAKVVFFEGGYEKNFKHEIKSVDQQKENSFWQNSALAGLKLKHKFGGHGAMTFSLLYDFLYEEHYPASVPLIYRMGYEFGK